MEEGNKGLSYFTAKDPDGTPLSIRDIDSDDLAAVTSIYNHYVIHTAVTFDTETFSTEQRQNWLAQFQPATRHQCLVLESQGNILGYASSARFRPKPAYDQSVETTIYLAPNALGHGYGQLLYEQLLNNLREQPIHRAYGIIALPNNASVELHRRLGYQEIGILHQVGYKFGKYHDTLWLENRFDTAP